MFISDTFIKSIPTYGDSPPAGHPEDLLALQIKLPPSIEQQRIADRIDELFTDLDAGVAALVRVQKKLNRYRAALLHAAVTGRLTADWRAKNGDGGENGQQLLQRILRGHREQENLRQSQMQSRPQFTRGNVFCSYRKRWLLLKLSSDDLISLDLDRFASMMQPFTAASAKLASRLTMPWDSLCDCDRSEFHRWLTK